MAKSIVLKSSALTLTELRLLLPYDSAEFKHFHNYRYVREFFSNKIVDNLLVYNEYRMMLDMFPTVGEVNYPKCALIVMKLLM